MLFGGNDGKVLNVININFLKYLFFYSCKKNLFLFLTLKKWNFKKLLQNPKTSMKSMIPPPLKRCSKNEFTLYNIIFVIKTNLTKNIMRDKWVKFTSQVY